MRSVLTGTAAVIGGGPAGLMAAEMLAAAGVQVDVFDAMPSVGRKFLLAGIGGLNLTHSEPVARFLERYGARRPHLEAMLSAFGADELRHWARGLGVETFVGSSGRVFPVAMKAAPLLRAWLQRLRAAGVRFHPRHRWVGWSDDNALRIATPHGERQIRAAVTILAPGGGSWPRLGSDGAWVPWLGARGIDVAPLRPANCGFDVGWSEHFRKYFAGKPLKPVAIRLTGQDGARQHLTGECIVTATGLEGGLIYALSAQLRDTIAATGSAVLHLDLAPRRSEAILADALARPRGSRSMANHLRTQAGVVGTRAGLLRECAPPQAFADPRRLAAAIKSLPVTLKSARPLDEAISSAGGVPFEVLDRHLMLRALPGVFCAGEMLDWEAPTGGYLLTACFATGRAAGLGAAHWLRENLTA